MLVIKGGQVYDPINGINGETKDIWIEGGKIVKSLGHIPQDVTVIDNSQDDYNARWDRYTRSYCRLNVNTGRKLCPEDHYEHFRMAKGGFEIRRWVYSAGGVFDRISKPAENGVHSQPWLRRPQLL